MRWPKVPFFKVAEVVTGNTPSKKDLENYGPGVPWVKPPDLDAWEPVTETKETLSEFGQRKARLLPPETVMVSCIGSIGRVGIAGTTLATNQQINSLIFSPYVNPRFGYYYCRSISRKLEGLARQAVVPILNKGNFEKIEMPLPPPSEQQRIVEILDQADELRKKRTEADAKAERVLPALFLKMFGDPATNPMGWAVRRLAEIASVRRGDFRHRPRNEPRFYGGPYPFIQINDITSSNIVIRRYTQTLNEDGLAISRMFSAGTVVVSIAATIAASGILGFDSCFPDSLVGVGGKKEKATQEFLLFLLRLLAPRLASQAPQLAQKNINLNILNELRVPVPPLAKQKIFSQEVSEIIGISDRQEMARGGLNNLWDSLIYRAFSGDLTAQWREGRMKELLTEMEGQERVLRAFVRTEKEASHGAIP